MIQNLAALDIHRDRFSGGVCVDKFKLVFFIRIISHCGQRSIAVIGYDHVEVEECIRVGYASQIPLRFGDSVAEGVNCFPIVISGFDCIAILNSFAQIGSPIAEGIKWDRSVSLIFLRLQNSFIICIRARCQLKGKLSSFQVSTVQSLRCTDGCFRSAGHICGAIVTVFKRLASFFTGHSCFQLTGAIIGYCNVNCRSVLIIVNPWNTLILCRNHFLHSVFIFARVCKCQCSKVKCFSVSTARFIYCNSCIFWHWSFYSCWSLLIFYRKLECIRFFPCTTRKYFTQRNLCCIKFTISGHVCISKRRFCCFSSFDCSRITSFLFCIMRLLRFCYLIHYSSIKSINLNILSTLQFK